MASKRIFVVVAVVAILGASLFMLFQSNKPPDPTELLKAEQEVYSCVILEQRGTYSREYVASIDIDELQVVEYTNSGELQGNQPQDSAGMFTSFNRDEFPGLQRKTWIDYQEKNKVSYPIKEFLLPTADVIFVNPANGEQLYWWVSFSRIGFNSSLTQALVLVGDCRGELCYEGTGNFMYSRGDYVFLQKENGEWTIKDRQRVWFIESPSP